MRPAGRGPLDSLYFDYPTFAAGPATAVDAPVVVVGAGPIGMTAALALARYGVRSVLIERKTTFNDGSRAICIARPSCHILERVGAVEPFMAKALGWTRGRSFYRGREVYRLEMPHPGWEKYLPMYNLQQQYIEQYLWDAVERSPLIETRWGCEVESVEQDGEGARLGVRAPAGAFVATAQYVVAADGARSPLRSMLGLRLRGDNYEGRYVIADVRMKHDYPTERRAFFEPASNPGGTVLIHRQPDDIWRIDYQLREGEDADAAVAEAEIRRRVQAILADVGHDGPWELEWWSVYTANTLCLDDYRCGRVFFAGDSAHIVPIFGVRGLNNGLADAHNIGWKLGYVLGGDAAPALLDSYTPERRGATLDVFANAARSTRFMTPPTRGWRLAREAALSLALRHEFARPLANPRQMTPYTYADSPLSAPDDRNFAAGPTPGAAAPNVRLDDGRHLFDDAGEGFTMLDFSAADDPARSGLFARLSLLDPRFKSIRLDPAGSVGRVYGAVEGSMYLLRPDLHVAGRWLRADEHAAIDTLSAGVGMTPS